MANRKRIIPTLKELREDMKDMTFGEKVDHIWTYYKEYFLLIGILALLVVAIVASAITASRNIVYSGVMANISISPEGMAFFSDDYAKELGLDQKHDVVELNYTNFSSLNDPTSTEDNYNRTILLTSMVSAGRMDYAIIDDTALEFYMTQDVFLDLREFFTEEELKALDEKKMVHYYSFQYVDADGNIVEEAQTYPVAIYISELPFAKAHIDNKKAYFCIGGNNPDMELTRRMWERLVNYE